jgi:hypothetical protein
MPALTKTEQALLAALTESRIGRLSVSQVIGSKPYTGGKVSTGVREYRAACRLVGNGLVREVKRSMHRESAHGWGCDVYELTIGKI